MKVFVVSDMEGVAGIVRWQQVTGGHAMYEEGRKLYTGEINAAVRGAKAAGATEIVVMDCHGAGEGWMFNSLIPEELDPDCEYVVQNEWTEYTDFLEGGVDAALFVGMHAMAGTSDGVLAHTVSGSSWWRLRFNGVEVGETGINAALCGTWGCPVLLVTGDEASCREGKALLGDGLTTVAVKQGLGRFSARQVPAPKARELIEDGARRALADLRAVSPYDPGSPCEIVVDFNTSDHVEKYRHRPGVEITEPRQITSRADDWWTAWRQFFFYDKCQALKCLAQWEFQSSWAVATSSATTKAATSSSARRRSRRGDGSISRPESSRRGSRSSMPQNARRTKRRGSRSAWTGSWACTTVRRRARASAS